MAHTTHEEHDHKHGSGCGHAAVKHDDHTDYVHDGHLHHVHDQHVDEHTIAASEKNPDRCSGGHGCAEHDASHKHASNCGHDVVPHGNHTDYLVAGHLHHAHESHCDDHGEVVRA